MRVRNWIPVLLAALLVCAGLRIRPSSAGQRLLSARLLDRAGIYDNLVPSVPAALPPAALLVRPPQFRGFVRIAVLVLAGSPPPPSFRLQRPPPLPA